jgi:hypothetical protein
MSKKIRENILFFINFTQQNQSDGWQDEHKIKFISFY